MTQLQRYMTEAVRVIPTHTTSLISGLGRAATLVLLQGKQSNISCDTSLVRTMKFHSLDSLLLHKIRKMHFLSRETFLPD